MKKLLLIATAIAVLTIGATAAFAQSEDGSNMDAETYLDVRTEQLDEALAEGLIDADQYDLLLAHITENATDGVFGLGGYENRDAEDCVLGEEGFLGIFRQGGGFGSGQCCNGEPQGTRQGSAGSGQGNGNRGQGMRLQDGSGDNEDCILD